MQVEGALRDISVSSSEWGALFNIDGILGEVLVSDLFYEGQVVQFEQMDLAGAATDANGKFYTWRKKNPVVFTISVFPGSESDITLANAMEACMSENGKYVQIKSAIWQVSNRMKMYFTNGTITAWLPGISAGGDNRMGPKTYRFAFEKVEIDGNGGFGV